MESDERGVVDSEQASLRAEFSAHVGRTWPVFRRSGVR